jgi:hypothetical protein
LHTEESYRQCLVILLSPVVNVNLKTVRVSKLWTYDFSSNIAGGTITMEGGCNSGISGSWVTRKESFVQAGVIRDWRQNRYLEM